jgi:hypothetical protein
MRLGLQRGRLLISNVLVKWTSRAPCFMFVIISLERLVLNITLSYLILFFEDPTLAMR